MATLNEVIALAQKTGRICVSPDMVDVVKQMPQLIGLEVVVSRYMSAGTLVAFEADGIETLIFKFIDQPNDGVIVAGLDSTNGQPMEPVNEKA